MAQVIVDHFHLAAFPNMDGIAGIHLIIGFSTDGIVLYPALRGIL